jgi:hypothetical protein
MPVAGMGGCDGPGNIFQIDPAPYPDIFSNIQPIIEGNEPMTGHLQIGYQRDNNQNQADKNRRPGSAPNFVRVLIEIHIQFLKNAENNLI